MSDDKRRIRRNDQIRARREEVNRLPEALDATEFIALCLLARIGVNILEAVSDIADTMEGRQNEEAAPYVPPETPEPKKAYLVSVEGSLGSPRTQMATSPEEAVKAEFISDSYNLTYGHPESFIYVCEGKRFQCESSLECGTLVAPLDE